MITDDGKNTDDMTDQELLEYAAEFGNVDEGGYFLSRVFAEGRSPASIIEVASRYSLGERPGLRPDTPPKLAAFLQGLKDALLR